MTSKRLAILQALQGRLERIRQSNGFDTDAGAQVFLGEAPAFGPDDESVAIVLAIGDEAPQWQQEKLFIRLPLEVQAVISVDLSSPLAVARWRSGEGWTHVEAVIADIKRAVELEDRTLDGLLELNLPLQRGAVRTLPREPGSTTAGSGVGYDVAFTEGWGAP